MRKKINITKSKYNILEFILIGILMLLLGILLGFFINKQPKTNSSIKEIEKVYNTIINEYITEVDKEELNDAAINGMMNLLKDKHSIYYNNKESDNYEIELSGQFYGIGIVINKEENEYAVIQNVYKNSPAEKAGLKEKDKIIKVDNVDVKTLSSDDMVQKIRGKYGVSHDLVIERNGQYLNIKITTGHIDIPSVESKIIDKDNKIGYLYIGVFASNTDEQVKEKLEEFDKENIDKIIIDLRYNSGGGLDTFINVASLFIEKDLPIINIESKKKTDTKVSLGNNNKKYKIVVLINEYSASASEALSGALNEQAGAELIGVTTYGKGTVQKTKYLDDGSIIKYTTETWKTPKGKSIEGVGIKPTIEVKQNDEYYKNPTDENDMQLQKAIDTLK